MPVTRSPARPVSGAPSYAPNDLPVYRGGSSGAAAAFSPEDLFGSGENGDWFDFRETTGLWVDSTASVTPVVSDGDLVGAAVGRRGIVTIIQATTTDKPIWKTTEIQADSTNQKTLTGAFSPTIPNTESHAIYVAGRLVVSNSAISNGTIARLLNGASITSQNIIRRSQSSHTIFGSSYTDTSSDVGLVDQYAYCSGIRPGTTSYRQSTHVARTAGTFSEASAVTVDNFAILCSRSTGNYGATKGAVFINRDLTESEVVQLNEYFGI